MTETEERALAAAFVRAGAAGAKVAAESLPDPTAKGIALGAWAVSELAAMLIEKVGASKAESILTELTENPALPITREELDADKASVKAEFGVPANPYVTDAEFVDPDDDTK